MCVNSCVKTRRSQSSVKLRESAPRGRRGGYEDRVVGKWGRVSVGDFRLIGQDDLRETWRVDA